MAKADWTVAEAFILGNQTKGPLHNRTIGQKDHGTKGPPDKRATIVGRKVHSSDSMP